MTNGERIRSMTDEELAALYEDHNGFGCEECSANMSPWFLPCDNKCKEHCKEWLRKEYRRTW